MLGALKPPGRRAAAAPAGVTLVELMVTLAIVAVLVAIALPSMRDFVARKRLEGIAQELATDLRLLKSHQIQNRPTTGTAISFGSNDTKTCYVVYVRGNNVVNCNCGLADDVMCGPANAPGLRPAPIRQVNIPLSTGVTLTASQARLAVGGLNGMPQFNETVLVSLTSSTAGEIRVSTNQTGVPLVCSVSGTFGAIQRCTP
jgi:type IV fimbrial biogenesis protein FimT